jgi:mRNA interferase RelE/StbE
MMKISASEQVADWLRHLAPEPKHRVRAALRSLEHWRGDIGPLHGELEGFYRLRIGGYRIVFRVTSRRAIRLEYADTRDVVYEVFRQLRMLSEMAGVMAGRSPLRRPAGREVFRAHARGVSTTR